MYSTALAVAVTDLGAALAAKRFSSHGRHPLLAVPACVTVMVGLALFAIVITPPTLNGGSAEQRL